MPSCQQVLSHQLLACQRTHLRSRICLSSLQPSQPPLQLSSQCFPGPPPAVPVPAAPALLWLRQLLLLPPLLRLPLPAPDLSATADREGEKTVEKGIRGKTATDRDRESMREKGEESAEGNPNPGCFPLS
eukprot:3132661-Rhodomonas_salina.3